jgi:hypothetical protein
MTMPSLHVPVSLFWPLHPTTYDGVAEKMIKISDTSRQLKRQAWTLDRLINKRSIALGFSLDSSTYGAYTSALNSYLTFCNMHNFPVDPMPDTLSFYAVYILSHINPRSTDSYLLGICRQLEPFFPDVCKNRHSLLIARTVKGCKRRFGVPIKRKLPLSHANLHLVLDSLSSPTHDNFLFIWQLLTGFYALLHLGELVFPDKKRDRNYRKIALCQSVQVKSVVPVKLVYYIPATAGNVYSHGQPIESVKFKSTHTAQTWVSSKFL